MSEIISKESLQALKKELRNLKLERRKIAADLTRTASFGDLTENSEYQQAREEKSLLEKRIFENDTGRTTEFRCKRIIDIITED